MRSHSAASAAAPVLSKTHFGSAHQVSSYKPSSSALSQGANVGQAGQPHDRQGGLGVGAARRGGGPMSTLRRGRQTGRGDRSSVSQAPTAGAAPVAPDSELAAERDRLTERFTVMQTELGGPLLRDGDPRSRAYGRCWWRGRPPCSESTPSCPRSSTCWPGATPGSAATVPAAASPTRRARASARIAPNPWIADLAVRRRLLEIRLTGSQMAIIATVSACATRAGRAAGHGSVAAIQGDSRRTEHPAGGSRAGLSGAQGGFDRAGTVRPGDRGRRHADRARGHGHPRRPGPRTRARTRAQIRAATPAPPAAVPAPTRAAARAVPRTRARPRRSSTCSS